MFEFRSPPLTRCCSRPVKSLTVSRFSFNLPTLTRPFFSSFSLVLFFFVTMIDLLSALRRWSRKMPLLSDMVLIQAISVGIGGHTFNSWTYHRRGRQRSSVRHGQLKARSGRRLQDDALTVRLHIDLAARHVQLRLGSGDADADVDAG